jgi:hypothetical protein
MQEHQLAVVDCLEDPDDTLKLKTLELLYKMTKVRGWRDFEVRESCDLDVQKAQCTCEMFNMTKVRCGCGCGGWGGVAT